MFQFLAVAIAAMPLKEGLSAVCPFTGCDCKDVYDVGFDKNVFGNKKL